MATILYISYDGLCEPLGQSQVYQYLVELVRRYDYRFQLITFEKPHDLNNIEKIRALKDDLNKLGITWYPMRYHKRFSVLATAYDIIRGLCVATYVVLKYEIKTIHVRSYTPAVIALILRLVLKKPFIFDMRGFWADEKVDVGSWRRDGPLYKIAKTFEKWFLLKSNIVISLTDAAISEMKRFPYLVGVHRTFIKISTCVNLNLFSPGQKNLNERFVVGYIGGASAWYNFDLAVKYYLEFKKRIPGAQFLIINANEQEFIRNRLAHYSITKSDYQLVAVPHLEMPAYIHKMKLVLFFIHPYFSKIASAPTKVGEILACGVPCITNGGVGDLASLLNDENVGIVVADHSDRFIEGATDDALMLLKDPGLQERCAGAAEKHFSLGRALDKYNEIYSQDFKLRS